MLRLWLQGLLKPDADVQPRVQATPGLMHVLLPFIAPQIMVPWQLRQHLPHHTLREDAHHAQSHAFVLIHQVTQYFARRCNAYPLLVSQLV